MVEILLYERFRDWRVGMRSNEGGSAVRRLCLRAIASVDGNENSRETSAREVERSQFEKIGECVGQCSELVLAKL